MNFKQFFFFLISLSVTVAYGQVAVNKFQKFADVQDSLFMSAYNHKDIQAYDKLLAEFLSQYNKLPDTAKKSFSSYLNGAYYNFCCTYSLMNKKELALVYLKKAIDAGYIDYAHMQEDKDLDNIREEKAFKDILMPLRNIGDFLFILKKAEQYNYKDTRVVPQFTYQNSDNQNLVVLRKTFNLDSIAGQGTDVYKIINVLHWIHFLIPHVGNRENPVVKNAMSMIAECRRDKRGLNCRGLATVLNECYLSLGIKSRIVTCYPKDSLKIDGDCHVINMVYSDTLKKWLWIDPTNNAYIMNEKGELLSIEEVRDRLINNKPLLLNPDANWNRNTIVKENYLYNYMAKNLYMLECPVKSEYNMETRQDGKVISYIKLLPLDYFAQSPDKSEDRDEKTNTIWIIYNTNNPKLFWSAP